MIKFRWKEKLIINTSFKKVIKEMKDSIENFMHFSQQK